MFAGVEAAIASDQGLSVISPLAARGIQEATGKGEDQETAQLVLQDRAANDIAVVGPAAGQISAAPAAVSSSCQLPNSPPGATESQVLHPNLWVGECRVTTHRPPAWPACMTGQGQLSLHSAACEQQAGDMFILHVATCAWSYPPPQSACQQFSGTLVLTA